MEVKNEPAKQQREAGLRGGERAEDVSEPANCVNRA